MQKQFKYIYNNEEVSRENFEKLAGDSFKWFDGGSIVSVPFSSFDSLFNGDFKSRRQINDHLDSVLNVYQNKVTEDIINKPKCSPQCFCDGSCKKPQEKNLGGYKIPNVKVNATRHKAREEGKFHKEIVGDLEEVNKPKGVEVSLKELKENTINNVELGLDIVDILGITLCDNRDYIYKLIEKKISAKKDKIKTAKLHTYPLTPEECLKDDVITNSSRGEKETMEYLNEGLKRTEGVKLNKLKPQISLLFKQFPDALEAIAKCSEYGHKKYKETDSDFLNFKRVAEGSKAYADAGLRHRLKKGIDLESMLPHCYHVAWNALAELQLLIEEK